MFIRLMKGAANAILMALLAHFRYHFLFSFDVAEQPIYGFFTEIYVSANFFFSFGKGEGFLSVSSQPLIQDQQTTILGATGATILEPGCVKVGHFLVSVVAKHTVT